MKIEDFISKLEDEFQDIPKGTLKPDTEYRNVLDWNSVNALILIALVNVEYDVVINADDLRACKSINDLYKIICSRIS